MSKKPRTITLTNAAPVRVEEDAWPVIAAGHWHNGEYDFQANYVDSIRVRQHADGRAIAYAVRDSGPGGAPQGWTGRRGGEVLPAGADLVAAIRRVGGECGVDESAIRDCISDLPAVDLE